MTGVKSVPYSPVASVTSAASRPSGVCGSASRSGTAPCARRASLVAGPIETSRGPRSASSPAAATRNRTVEADVNVR